MMCYRDMTFCTESTCAKFGDGNDDCQRSLTLAVEHLASHWWHNGKWKEGEDSYAPIMVFLDRQECYKEEANDA